MNPEIYSKFKSPDIMTVNEVQRWEWFGHFVRVDGERMVKMLLEGKPGAWGRERDNKKKT